MCDNLEGQRHHISRKELFEVWCSSPITKRHEGLLRYVLHQFGLENASEDWTRLSLDIGKLSALILTKWKSAGNKKDRFIQKNREWLESEVFGSVDMANDEDEKSILKPGPLKCIAENSTPSKQEGPQHIVVNVTDEPKVTAQIDTSASGNRITAKATAVNESPEERDTNLAAGEVIEEECTLTGMGIVDFMNLCQTMTTQFGETNYFDYIDSDSD